MKTPRVPAFVPAAIASLETNFRVMASVILVLLVLGLAPQSSLAQAVSASPTSLSFGIPSGTSPAVSSVETVTVSIAGSESVTFTSDSVTGPAFAIVGDSCLNNTFSAGATCQIAVTLTTSSASLVTDTLSIVSSGSPSPLSVPLSGAYGAIKLLDATTVQLSASGASFATPTTIGSAPLNLSCPLTPTATTAKLSNTPDGLGYVLVDNYLVMGINGSPVVNPVANATPFSPPGNVCTGGDTDGFAGTTQQDCFSDAYRSAVDANSILGDNTDTVTDPSTSVLPSNAPGGVMAIDVSSFFPASSSTPTTVQASFTLLDAGGFAAGSSLFLVTNCSPAGIVSGGSITGSTSSTNTFSFDSSPGQNVSLVSSTAQNPPPPGTYPIATDIAIPQQLLYQLVNGTSAAPAVCFRMSAELDYSVSPPAPMCKGFLIQCYDPNSMTTSGDNCDPTPSAVRNLYNTAQFTSPDGPVNGHNYLYVPVGSPAADACSYYLKGVKGGACAALTGPGMLLGGDLWLTCELASCTSNPPLPPNTMTPASPATYSTANCALTGVLTGDLCPLNLLTQFLGAADPKPGSTTVGLNSIFVPVVNMPLPYAVAAIKNLNNGWVTTSSPQVAFVATPAIYVPLSNNPKANNFKPAPLYSVTFGTTLASNPLPDPTYQIPGDTILYTSYASQNFVSPLCPPSTQAKLFSPTANMSGLTNGSIYNLHFFATDCALSEGLVFLPQGSQLTNPTANWASFEYVTFGVDTTAPTLSVPNPPTTYKLKSTATVPFSCATPGPSGLQNCGTSLSANLPATGYPAVGKDSAYSSSATLPTTKTGTFTVTFYARTEAGLQVSQTYTYKVTN
jgi:hypothetical protein